MNKYKLGDIKPYSLVVFKKHNGKGRRITYRTIFVNYVVNYPDAVSIAYDTFDGSAFALLRKDDYGKEFEILDIKYYYEEIN